MGRNFGNKLEAWRAERARRNERREQGRLKRRPAPRPGGTSLAALPERPEAATEAPIPKHVPRNTHRPGSIAYALLYAYRRVE